MDAWFVVHSLVGFFLLHALAWSLSEDRKTIVWRPVIAGMLLTFGLGVVLLTAPPAKHAFFALNDALNALEKATREGTAFAFGFLGGGPLPFAETYPGASFVLAFRALPLVLVVSALSALLFHWRGLARSVGIGRAAGWGRGESLVGAGSLKKKKKQLKRDEVNDQRR